MSLHTFRYDTDASHIWLLNHRHGNWCFFCRVHAWFTEEMLNTGPLLHHADARIIWDIWTMALASLISSSPHNKINQIKRALYTYTYSFVTQHYNESRRCWEEHSLTPFTTARSNNSAKSCRYLKNLRKPNYAPIVVKFPTNTARQYCLLSTTFEIFVKGKYSK
jgi:hypothetical protein